MSIPSNAHSREGTVDSEKLEQEFVETLPVDEFSPEDEKKLVKKLDRRIMSIASILYLFGCESFLTSVSLQRLRRDCSMPTSSPFSCASIAAAVPAACPVAAQAGIARVTSQASPCAPIHRPAENRLS